MLEGGGTIVNGLVNVVIILDGGLVQEVEVFDSPQEAHSFFKEKTGFEDPEKLDESGLIEPCEGSRIEVRRIVGRD